MMQKILVVDDEPFNVIGIQIYINNLGIKGLSSIVDRAFNGLEALNKVRDSYESGSHIYSLIFTDISMPIKNGFELSKDIREYYHLKQARQPMIIACTGHVEEEFINKAWLHDIDEILPKPMSMDTLQ